ncbi:hypothetical protein ACFLU3_06110, partial [Chloroflexota bacterium]
MPDLSSKTTLKKLLNAAMQHSDQKYLRAVIESESQYPYPRLYLLFFADKKMREKYIKALTGLHDELVPNYISVEKLMENLWTLFKETVLNRQVYTSNSNALKNLIDNFSSSVKQPLKDYEVIYQVENLEVGDSHIKIGKVDVFKPAPDYLSESVFTEKDTPQKKALVDEWSKRTVAKVTVSVSDIDRGYESGLPIAQEALNIIKLAAVKPRIWRLHDEMFLWRLGQYITVPKDKNSEGVLWSVTSPRNPLIPLVIPLGDDISKALSSEGTWQYIIDGALPKDINVRVVKALEWISHAVGSDSLDYRLVDLCTALEILLLPNHKEGAKGELIALRQVLLGGASYFSPDSLLHLYEKRNDIVHQGALEIT